MSANIQILGNLGREPEIRTSENGNVIASFSIASNSVQRTPQGTEKKTDWFRVTALGKQAETIAAHAQRGSRLLVSGKLTFNPWKDRQGRPQVSADLLLQDFQFVGDGGSGNAEKASGATKSPNAGERQEHSVETVIPDYSGDVQEVPNQTRDF